MGQILDKSWGTRIGNQHQDLEDEESGEDVANAQVLAVGEGGGYGGAAGHGGALIAAAHSASSWTT